MKNITEIVKNFLKTFKSISKFQRKIFKYLHWFSKKFHCVFPGLQKIANAIGSSTRTVIRATELFVSLGWMYKKKRGYQSNLYFINDEIIALDLNDEKIFHREECHHNVTVLESSFPDKENICTRKQKVPIYKNIENRHIPEFLKNPTLKMDPKDQQRLANAFTERELYESINDGKWYVKAGNRVGSWIAFLWYRASAHSRAFV